MKPRRLRRIRFTHSDRRMSPLDRLAEAFVRERDDSNWERIRQMREAYFADVVALQKSGTLKIPE